MPSEEQVREALRSVIDPEAGMNIVDLGLIYRVDAMPGRVAIEMTMTTPACPVGPMLVDQVRDAVRTIAPEAEIGEYVIVHVGFAIQRLDEESAKQTLANFERLGILEEEFGAGFETAARDAGVPAGTALEEESA